MVFKRVKNVLSEVLDISLSESEKAEYLVTQKWDSLGHVSVILGLEKEFGVTIDTKNLEDLFHYDDIVKYFSNLTLNTTKFLNESFVKKEKKIHRGLNNIYFDNTKISFVDKENASLSYRGYDINEIIENGYSFVEVIFLVLFGYWPNNNQLMDFEKKLTKGKDLVLQNKNLFKSDMFLSEPNYLLSSIPKILELIDDDIEFISALPTSFLLRRSNELEHIIKAPSLLNNDSYAEYILYCLNPGAFYSQNQIDVFEKQMILHIEHGANASAFSCRVSGSTKASFGNSLLSAVGTFSGELHGGALKKVYKMIEGFENNPIDIEKILEDKIKSSKPVYGFGHRIYNGVDPRALILKELLDSLDKKNNINDTMEVISRIVSFLDPYSKKGLGINVDFYSAVILKQLNLDSELCLPSFIFSRVSGWLAHYNEQLENNVLIRPRLNYIGEKIC